MKKSILSIFTILLSISFSSAADLIVDITGVGGAYSTISSAVAASSPGDRLMIYPNVTPFSEDFTIPHSLTLASAVEGERWRMTGTITVSFTIGDGAEVNIVSMDLIDGSCNSSGNISGEGNVRILGSVIRNGNVVFNNNNFNLTLQNDSLLNGYVHLRKGRITGNYITTGAQNLSCIYTTSNNVTSDEPTYIVGNHIVATTYTFFTQNPSALYWNANSQPYVIANNYIEMMNNDQHAIRVTSSYSSGTAVSRIENNTISAEQTTNDYAIFITSLSSNVEVLNNLITGSAMTYGIGANQNSLNLSVSYNNITASTAPLNPNILDDGTNVLNDPQTIDPLTGELTAGSGIDGGNPDAAFTDLDLTRNDVGCYGGSYSRENFTSASTGARTTFMIAPRRVLVGETIDIQGEGFDY